MSNRPKNVRSRGAATALGTTAAKSSQRNEKSRRQQAETLLLNALLTSEKKWEAAGLMSRGKTAGRKKK
jgi:hypothetical protein